MDLSGHDPGDPAPWGKNWGAPSGIGRVESNMDPQDNVSARFEGVTQLPCRLVAELWDVAAGVREPVPSYR